MNILLIIIWIIGITSFTLLGSWYARKFNKSDLLLCLYVTFVLISQILAAKISQFNLGFATYSVTSGILVFSVTYLLTDIVNEKFGKKEVQKMIFIALISQIAMIFFFYLGIVLPPAPFWSLQGEWKEIFGIVPRITIASWISFLVSENFDAYLFHWFKKLTKGKYLWTRNALSSIPALLLDSLIFIPLAFGGTLPILPLIIGQTTIKWLVGLVNIPFMYLNQAVLNSKQRRKK